jgi:hypothetical protein
LFAGAGPETAWCSGAELWRWLTPVAACVLAVLVAMPGSSRRLARLGAPDSAASFATLALAGASSNLQQTFVLSKLDENVEWNFWPHPLSTQTSAVSRAWSGPNFRGFIPTNR